MSRALLLNSLRSSTVRRTATGTTRHINSSDRLSSQVPAKELVLNGIYCKPPLGDEPSSNKA